MADHHPRECDQPNRDAPGFHEAASQHEQRHGEQHERVHTAVHPLDRHRRGELARQHDRQERPEAHRNRDGHTQ